MPPDTRVVASWDMFALIMLSMSWVTFVWTPTRQIRQLAQAQDESRTFIFILIVGSAFVSLFAILILLSKHQNEQTRGMHVVVSLLAVTCSWLLVHTVFTLRYAHRYYGDKPNSVKQHAGGLLFPGSEEPGYLDCAYFSFVIGMTAQVSDVAVSTAPMRRLVLLHSLISFAFNTVIVALGISTVSGLLA